MMVNFLPNSLSIRLVKTQRQQRMSAEIEEIVANAHLRFLPRTCAHRAAIFVSNSLRGARKASWRNLRRQLAAQAERGDRLCRSA